MIGPCTHRGCGIDRRTGSSDGIDRHQHRVAIKGPLIVGDLELNEQCDRDLGVGCNKCCLRLVGIVDGEFGALHDCPLPGGDAAIWIGCGPRQADSVSRIGPAVGSSARTGGQIDRVDQYRDLVAATQSCGVSHRKTESQLCGLNHFGRLEVRSGRSRAHQKHLGSEDLLPLVATDVFIRIRCEPGEGYGAPLVDLLVLSCVRRGGGWLRCG